MVLEPYMVLFYIELNKGTTFDPLGTENDQMAGDPRKTMTVDETAIELGISRNAAYEAVKRGEIPSIRIGRRLLIPKAAFDRMLAEAGQGEAA